ncbi:CHAT domain-containing protein [Pedobacter frigiditerrae]|uniref:CHAT domain-containing protein n=1 Tax=Pedobacter frigiditerrae TaxID=2530452 RepID=A0A4R0MY61_9SPHI|nr:CHAT domain-containing tetratricopeptide repeat protein [Pedobacter frigiditerrae]TCC92200.1 CHAT domain-containing protein [Pedobacter frigiditerrae]
MRLVRLRFTFLTLLICSSIFLFAQGDAIQKKLDSFKQKDNLSDWIYERLNYVTENPQLRLAYLMETQSKAWRKAKTASEHYVWLNLLSTQGYYQLLDGNILSSINSYEAAFDYYLKNKVADYDIVEYTFKPLSNNYTRLGDYEKAVYLQQRSISFLLRKNDLPENIALLYSNMAISYRSMGNLNEAEKSINAGLKLAKQNSKVNIILNNILAGILFDKKEYATAAKLIELNISKQKNINQDNAYWLMGSYTYAGDIFRELNKLSQAESYFSKALNILNKYYNGTRLREKANILTQLGSIKLLAKEPQLAIAYFNETLTTLRITNLNKVDVNKIYGDNMVVNVFQEMAGANLQLNKPKEAYQYIKLALLSADKIRNEFADDKTKERLQVSLKLIAEKGIEITFNLYQQTKDKSLLNEILNLAEQSKSRTLLDQINRNQVLAAANQKDSLFIKKQAYEKAIIYNEKQEIEGKSNKSSTETAKLKYFLALVNKQIKQTHKQFNSDRFNTPITKVLLALPNQKIIEYFFGKDAVYIIDINNRQVNNVIKLDNSRLIKTAIQTYANTYFQHGADAMINEPKAFYLASHQIYQTILRGIKLQKNESVIIVPDDVLGFISFDGLITDKNYKPSISSWPFLIKSNSLTYAFSLKTLIAQKKASSAKNFTGLFITHQKNGLKPLQAVEDEAVAIKKVLKGDFLFNEKVNSAMLNKTFENSQVLHIGTHAYLSGKNQEPTLDLGKEKLFLFELSAKKQAPSLVVLSACRTADGLLANGEGIISLSRGFIAIGTPATIAGLWNVNDVVASVIIGDFYKHIVSHKSNGEALHQTKIDWLNKPQNNNAFYLPYYWDNLIYMGTDQHIELTSATNWGLIWGVGAVFVILLAMILVLRRGIGRAN